MVVREEIKSLTLRFAAMKDVWGVFKILNDGSTDGQCSAAGIHGSVVSDIFIERWLRIGNNCTISTYLGYGDFSKGTGMKGAIANDEADLTPYFQKSYEEIGAEYTDPILKSSLDILSAYNYSSDMKDADLLSTYLSFHWSYYLSIVITFALFTAAWSYCLFLAKRIRRKLKNQIKHARKPCWWIMTCAILDQDQYPNISRVAFTILSLCFSLLFYLLIDCFMLNMISTDLVVIEEPAVVRDYNDIVDRDDGGRLKVLLRDGSAVTGFFESAPEGSPEARIWERHVNFLNLSLGQQVKCLFEQKCIAFTRNYVSLSLANLLLQGAYLNNAYKRSRIYLVQDPTDKSFLGSLMVNTNAHSKVKSFIHHSNRRAVEGALYRFGRSLRKPYPEAHSMLRYIAGKLDLPDPPQNRIERKHLKSLEIVCGSMIWMSSCVLLGEIALKMWRRLWWQKRLNREIGISNHT